MADYCYFRSYWIPVVEVVVALGAAGPQGTVEECTLGEGILREEGGPTSLLY